MPRKSTAKGEENSAKVIRKSGNSPARPGQGGGGKEERQHMIATAAYYRAEIRGFNSGDEVQDWLEAEAEIDAMLFH